MTAINPDSQGLTTYSRFVLYGLVLPLIFIAGIQLFVLSEQTETYFAWTFAVPTSAAYMGGGFVLLSAFAIPCGLGLFLMPEAMSTFWPWAVTPLAARAVSLWLTAFDMACFTLTFENDIKHGAGTCSSLFAFCVIELIVVARYGSAINFGKPLAVAYILFLFLGMLVTGGNLLANRRLANV